MGCYLNMQISCNLAARVAKAHGTVNEEMDNKKVDKTQINNQAKGHGRHPKESVTNIKENMREQKLCGKLQKSDKENKGGENIERCGRHEPRL